MSEQPLPMGGPPPPDPSILTQAAAVIMAAGGDPYARGAAERAMERAAFLYTLARGVWHRYDAEAHAAERERQRAEQVPEIEKALKRFGNPGWGQNRPQNPKEALAMIFESRRALPFAWWGCFVTNQIKPERSAARLEASPVAELIRRASPTNTLDAPQPWHRVWRWHQMYAIHAKDRSQAKGDELNRKKAEAGHVPKRGEGGKYEPPPAKDKRLRKQRNERAGRDAKK